MWAGYLKSDGKIPKSSVRDKKNWLGIPPEDGSDYLGILKNGYIQIDIDSQDDSNLIMEILQEKKIRCNIIQTERGKHFFFKNDKKYDRNSVGIFSALGIEMDIGIGGTNRVIPLRVTNKKITTRIIDGEEVEHTSFETIDRPILQSYSELDNLPAWLRPIDRVNRSFKDTKFRNQDLFTYILVLQTHGFTRQEVRETLKLINQHILHEPLPERELNTITRDDAFSEEIFFGEKGKFLHDRFGDYMLSNGNVVRIADKINIYTRDLIYSDNPDDFERMFIDKIAHLKDIQREEV